MEKEQNILKTEPSSIIEELKQLKAFEIDNLKDLYQITIGKTERLISKRTLKWWEHNQKRWHIKNSQIELGHIEIEARSQVDGMPIA